MATILFEAKKKKAKVKVLSFEGKQTITLDGENTFILEGENGERVFISHEAFDKAYKVEGPKLDKPKKLTPVQYMKAKGIYEEFKRERDADE